MEQRDLRLVETMTVRDWDGQAMFFASDELADQAEPRVLLALGDAAGLQPLGRHALRGVREPREIYAPEGAS